MTAMSTPSAQRVSPGAVFAAALTLAAVSEAVASSLLSLGAADIMGDTHATPDESAWLNTGYTALKLIGFCIAPWLSARFNLNFLVLVATLMMAVACGLAAMTADTSALAALRMMQGFAGGVLVISGQTLFMLASPRKIWPLVLALFALGSVVTPAAIAPAIQGWLVDNRSWAWIFTGNALIAMVAAGLLLMSDGRPLPDLPRLRFDWAGFMTLSAGLACLTYLFVQGDRWNWFREPRIVWLAVAALSALLAFAALKARPRNGSLFGLGLFDFGDFAFAFFVSFVAGAALFGSAYLIPAFAVSVLGLTATDAGMLLLPSGGLFIAAMFLAAFLMQTGRIPPIATVPFGITLIMLAMWLLAGSNMQSGAQDMMTPILLRGLGLGFLFLSIQLVAFNSLPDRHLAAGIALFNIGRQMGGLMGVAALETLVSHGAALNRSVLGAHLTDGNPAVAERLGDLTAMLAGKGMDATSASQMAGQLIGQMLMGQVNTISFNAAFYSVALLFVLAVPLLIVLKITISHMFAKT